MITIVRGKNQITIPVKLVRQLNIQSGQRIDWQISEDGNLIAKLLPHKCELARQVAGMGRLWLDKGSDPVADLIEERIKGDDD